MSTQKDRQKLWSKLSDKFDRWSLLNDQEMLLELKKVFPMAVAATRDECIKFLVMDHTEKMIK